MKTSHIELKLASGKSLTVPATPIQVVAGEKTHTLAVHRLADAYAVSDYRSGARVLKVTGRFGFVATLQNSYKADAVAWALDQVNALIARIGAEKFNAVLEAGVLVKPKRAKKFISPQT